MQRKIISKTVLVLFFLVHLATIFSCSEPNVRLTNEFTIRCKVSHIECEVFRGTRGECFKERVYVQTDIRTYSFVNRTDDFKFQKGDIIYLNIREYIHKNK